MVSQTWKRVWKASPICLLGMHLACAGTSAVQQLFRALFAHSHHLAETVCIRNRYGGVVKRESVAAGADWYIDSFDVLLEALTS